MSDSFKGFLRDQKSAKKEAVEWSGTWNGYASGVVSPSANFSAYRTKVVQSIKFRKSDSPKFYIKTIPAGPFKAHHNVIGQLFIRHLQEQEGLSVTYYLSNIVPQYPFNLYVKWNYTTSGDICTLNYVSIDYSGKASNRAYTGSITVYFTFELRYIVTPA